MSETQYTPEMMGPPSYIRRAVTASTKLLALAGLSVGAGLAASTALPAESELGPHRVEATLSFDGNATLDFGAPGSIIKPLENGMLGARVAIKEIPITFGDTSDLTTLNQEDIDNYTRFFSNYEADISELRQDIARHVLKLSGIAAGFFLMSYGIIGQQRRGELTEQSTNIGRHVAGSKLAKVAAAGLLIGGTLTGEQISNAGVTSLEVDTAFDGTILEGARVDGRIMHVLINTYGQEILERIEENEQFYDQLAQDLPRIKTAYHLGDTPGKTTMLFHTDLHCNIGMAEMIGKTANLLGVNVVASGGDDVISGTEIEEECVRILDKHLGNTAAIHAGGNHGSDITERQLKRYGIPSLQGKVAEVAGLRFIGDDDPRISFFGQSIQQERQETVKEMGTRLTTEACRIGNVDIALVHSPEVAAAIAHGGCVKLVLSGHTHKESIRGHLTETGLPIPNLTGASVGGAENGGTTIGPLKTEARMYAIEFNSYTKQPLRYQILVFSPDGSINILAPQKF